MAKYKDIVLEVVDKLPHDLDGVKLYIMDCSDSEGTLGKISIKMADISNSILQIGRGSEVKEE